MSKIIQYTQAKEMEINGDLIIYDTDRVVTPLNQNSNFSLWKENFQKLKQKFKKVPLHRLIEFLDFDYIIEYKHQEQGDTPTTTWSYSYGKTPSSAYVLEKSFNKGKYVYILTNEAYPHVCKIGKAIQPTYRVTKVNGSGTVSEWQLRWALPVSDDYKVESIVHKTLEHLRMNSFQGSSREFFSISLDEAIKVIEDLGQEFKTDKGVYYE
jgi:hypothetical protein